MNKLNKLGAMLNKYYFEGKLPKCATQADVAILQCCYNDLIRKEHPEFISLNAKNILENIGYTTTTKETGWIVVC